MEALQRIHDRIEQFLRFMLDECSPADLPINQRVIRTLNEVLANPPAGLQAMMVAYDACTTDEDRFAVESAMEDFIYDLL